MKLNKTLIKDLDLFLGMMDLYEFELHFTGNNFLVRDIQGGNLGNIEGDRFKCIGEIIDRMGIYHEDYMYRDLEELKDAGEEPSQWDLDVIGLIENCYCLDKCTVEVFKKYLDYKNIEMSIFEVNQDYEIE